MEVLHPNYGLTKSRKEGYSDESFINPLPRAVIRRSSYVLLDGEWNFSVDPQDLGLTEEWQHGHEYSNTANWPGSIEEHMAKGNQELKKWEDKIVVWYERDFPLPAREANVEGSNQMLQLTFGACGYETMVWLNGHLMHTIEGEMMHVGEYTSFSYELDDKFLQPVNRLTVRIADTMDSDIPRGKQESIVYKRGGIWYQTYSGAVRSVWLETVERNRLRSRVGVLSVVEDNLVRINLTTRIHDAGTYRIRLKVFNKNQALR